MKKIINFQIYKGDEYFVAECNDLQIITQGKTIDETIINIKEALSLHLDGENLFDLGFSNSPAILINYDMGELVDA